MGAEGSISKNSESDKVTGEVALTNNLFQSNNHPNENTFVDPATMFSRMSVVFAGIAAS